MFLGTFVKYWRISENEMTGMTYNLNYLTRNLFVAAIEGRIRVYEDYYLFKTCV